MKKIKYLVAFAALMLCGGAWADVDETGITPKYWNKFDSWSNSSPYHPASGSESLTPGDERGSASNLTDAGQKGGALTTVNGSVHPNGTNLNLGEGDWTIVSSLKIPTVNHTKYAPLVVIGDTWEDNRGLGLFSTKGDSEQVHLIGWGSNFTTPAGTILKSVTVSDASTAFHSYAVTFNQTSHAFTLYVDGVAQGDAVEISSNEAYGGSNPLNRFQWGGVPGGVNRSGKLPSANYERISNVVLDDFRVYVGNGVPNADKLGKIAITAYTSNSDGAVMKVTACSGVFDLGTSRPTLTAIDGSYKLKLLPSDKVAAKVTFPIDGITESYLIAGRFSVLDVDGGSATLASQSPFEIDQGQLVINLATMAPITVDTAEKSFSAAIGDATAGVLDIIGTDSDETAYTVTVDRAIPDGVSVYVSGHVKFEAADGFSIPYTAMHYNAGAAITLPSASAITIPNGLTVTVETLLGDITNNGVLNVTGTCSFKLINGDSGTANFKRGAIATVSANQQSIRGTVNVEAGAKFINTTSDALYFDGTANFRVWGTLDMGATRWTMGSNTKLYAYDCAVIDGTGEMKGADNQGNFDPKDGNFQEYFIVSNYGLAGDATGQVTCSALTRTRATARVHIDPRMTLKYTGEFVIAGASSNQIKILGGGTMELSNAFRSTSGILVDAGTLKLVGINPAGPITLGNNKLELAQNGDADYEVTAAITGNGRISCVNGTTTISNCGSFTGNLQAEGADSKLVVNSDLTASIYDSGDNSGTVEIPVGKTLTTSAFAGAKKVLVNGTYKFTSTTQMDLREKNLSSITGSGEMYITGSKYFILPKQDWMWSSDLTIINDRGGDNEDNYGIIFGVPNNNYVIGNLSGTGLFRTDYSDGNRNVKVVQSKDTTWSGLFRGTDRLGTFEVDGKAGVEGSHVLTLATTNPNTHENALKVDQNGSVKLTGAWKGDVTVNGRFEKMNDATYEGTISGHTGILTKADSVIYFGSDEIASAEAEAKIVVGDVTTYYETVQAAIAAVGPQGDITTIKIIGEPTIPSGYCVVEGHLAYAAAKVGDEYYASIDDAITAAGVGDAIEILSDISSGSNISTGKDLTIYVPAGKSYTVSRKFRTGYSFTKTGAGTLTANITINSGKALNVNEGTLNLTTDSQGVKGTLNVAAGAVFNNNTTDMFTYSNAGAVANIRGTVNLDTSRWTVQGNIVTLNVYAGATIKGTHQTSSANALSMDLFKNITVNFKNGDVGGDVNWQVETRLRENSAQTFEFNIEEGVTVKVSKIITDCDNSREANFTSMNHILKKTGAGTLEFIEGSRLDATFVEANAGTVKYTAGTFGSIHSKTKISGASALVVSTSELAAGKVATEVSGKAVKKVVNDDTTVTYSLVDASPETPITPEEGEIVIPVVPDAGIAVEPGADVKVPTNTDASKIDVVYVAEDGTKTQLKSSGYVTVTVNSTTGAVELNVTTDAKPAVTEMTETSVSEVSISFMPVPGLFYTLESGDTPNSFTPGDAEQATSSDTKTLQLAVPTGDAKVKFYRVSVKATR